MIIRVNNTCYTNKHFLKTLSVGLRKAVQSNLKVICIGLIFYLILSI